MREVDNLRKIYYTVFLEVSIFMENDKVERTEFLGRKMVFWEYLMNTVRWTVKLTAGGL